MKKLLNKSILVLLVVALTFVFATSVAFAAAWDITTRVKDADIVIPEFGNDAQIQTYWDYRLTFSQYESLFKYLDDTYSHVKKYSIGHTWEERNLWCLEISSGGNGIKTPIAVIGNIHGGEHESAATVAYTAWWLATGYAAGDAEAVDALDGYIYYIIPVMNADGYERSMYVNTRQNMRPRGLARDEYFDINNDGKVGNMFVGTNDTTPPTPASTNTNTWAGHADNDGDAYNFLGLESYDTNNNGRFGDSTKQSAIDMNRSFDFLWTLYRPENAASIAAGYTLLGASGTWNDDATLRSAGPGPASEPEVQAIQNFLTIKPPAALVSAHTGIQCVLYPWCYTELPTDDHAFFAATAESMRAAFEATVRDVRRVDEYECKFYVKQSYDDYPTSSEMIDWAYARLGTHAYTIEVYSQGNQSGSASSDSHYRWNDAAYWSTYFPSNWKYLGQLSDGRTGGSKKTYDNVWINYTTAQMRAGEAPPDQYIMCEGFKNAVLEMAYAEDRATKHPDAPDWMLWALKTSQPGY